MDFQSIALPTELRYLEWANIFQVFTLVTFLYLEMAISYKTNSSFTLGRRITNSNLAVMAQPQSPELELSATLSGLHISFLGLNA